MSLRADLRALPRAVWVQCAATLVNRTGTMVLPFLFLAFPVARTPLAAALGMSLGPALGGFLATWSYGAPFIVDGLTSLAAAAILAKAGRPGAPTQPWRTRRRDLTHPRLTATVASC